MDAKKLMLTMLLLSFMMVPMVSAFQFCEWVPFWSCEEDGNTLTATSKWITEYSNDEGFFVWMDDAKKHKATICLVSETANSTGELPDKESYVAENKEGKNKEKLSKIKAKKIKAADTGLPQDYYGYCYTVKDKEKYHKFGEHSTVVIYEEDVLEAKDIDGNILQDVTLTENTDQCLTNCYARGNVVLYQEDKLFDDFDFADRYGNIMELNNAKISLKVIQTEVVSIPNYIQNCTEEEVYSEINGTTITITNCTRILNGTTEKIIDTSYYEDYDFSLLPAGSYEWQISANKKAGVDADWAFSFQGFDTDTIREHWAWWTDDWEYKRTLSNLTGDISYLEINKSENVRPDFGDIRFIANDTIELNYTIEAVFGGNGYSYDSFTEYSPQGYENVSQDELIAYYKLDETSGTVAEDETGANNLTASSGILNGTTGKLGTSGDFNGGIYHMRTDTLGTGTSWTVQMWLKGSDTSNQYLLDGRPSGSDGFLIRINSNNLEFIDDGTTQHIITSASNILDGEWHQLVMRADGTSHETFIDGHSVDTKTITATIMNDGNYTVFGGIRPDGGAGTVDYNGLMDEIAIYNRTLTTLEIEQMYDQGLLNGLVAYYDLDEASGSTAYDSTGVFNLTETGSTSTPNNPGVVNTGWNFTGSSSDYLASSSNSGISGNAPRTLSAWVYYETTTTSVAIGIGNAAANEEFALGTAGGYFSIVGYSNDNTATTMPLSLNTWYYLVASFDGTTVKGYVNGVEVINAAETYNTANDKILIGKRKDWGAAHNGTIDEVAVWDRALTQTEVFRNYNASRAQFRVNNLGEESINMYYGNPNATTTESASDTYFNPISAYYLDANANDFVGDNYGTISGAFLTAGYINNSYNFSGGHNYIGIASAGSSPFDSLTAGNFSVSLWYNTDTTIGQRGVLGNWQNNAGEGGWQITENAGKLTYVSEHSSGDQFRIVTTTDSVINSSFGYQHVVFTDIDNVGTFWVDGVEITSYSSRETLGTCRASTRQWQLGSQNTANANTEFALDEVMIWDKALSDSEISALYNQTAPNYIEGAETTSAVLNITQTDPADSYSSSLIDVNFSCDAYDPVGVYSLNLTINGSVYETVTGPGTTNLSLSSTETLSDGSWEWNCTANSLIENGTSATRTLTVDTTPNIQLVSPTPTEGENVTLDYFTVNVSLTETYFQNVTFYLYENGTLNETVSFTNSTRSYNKTNCADGEWSVNATTWTTTGQTNTTALRTFTIHSTEPTVIITNPNGTSGYFLLGGNQTLDYNISEAGANLTTHLNSCWYTYNYSNVSLNCSENTTSFEYISGANNLTIYAEDEYGLIGSYYTEWRYILLESTQSYGDPVYETSIDQMNVTLEYVSSDWSSAVGYLIYDGTEYGAISSGTGDEVVLNYNLTAEAVSVDTNKSFYWIITLTNATGSYNFSSTAHNHTVMKVNFFLCDYASNPQLFFKTFSTTDPTTSVNATFASAWELRDAEAGDEILSRSFEDTTEVNSSWGFCIEPNSTAYTISVDITVDATDYTPTSHFIVDTDYSGPGGNVSLYLLNDSFSTLTELLVTDQDNQPVKDTYITIQRYDMGTDTYYNVGMARTDNEGSDLAYMSWYDDWYRFVGTYSGAVVFSEGPKKVSSSPLKFSFGDIAGSAYEKYRDIVYSLTFNDATENFVLTYVSPSGDVSEHCLRTIKRNVTADYLVCETCESSNSATLYCNIASAGNGTFISNFYASASPRYYIDSLVEARNIQNEFYEMIGNDNGTGLAIIFAGIVLTLFLITPALGILGAMLGMVGAIALGFQPLDYTAFIGIIFVGGMMMWAVQK